MSRHLDFGAVSVRAVRVEGVDVGDQGVEELEFHRETIEKDASSPLHLIREKEIEISARLLSAKREADAIVTEARKRAVAISEEAQSQAVSLAEDRDRTVAAEVERSVADVIGGTEGDVATLESTIAARSDKAVAFVVESVLKV